MDEQITFRQYLLRKVLYAEPGTDIFVAIESVDSTAIEHPEWDMKERKTWKEWEEDQQFK